MDLVEKWSAFLPHAEHISPTQFCAITLSDVREMISEYQAMRARVDDLDDRVMEISDRYDNACNQADDWQWCAEARGKRVAELEAQIAAHEHVVHGALAARAVVHYINDLMGESRGIYGFHLNGDPCPWDYFDDLRSLIDDAMDAKLPTISGEPS